ncbi:MULTISPECIES: tripartite tricarboxylate transporter permease [unclassified Sinorhizobium]|uniref:tripartite tricarboxylate transporter permease n=1 Tax=unclassified Sinorhizobium TaxID=2613772 RepID=UPI0035259479
MNTWDAVMQGLGLVLAWPAIGFLFLGTVIGLYVGAVPGIGALVTFSLLIPFTFHMDPGSSIALLLGVFAVTTTGDTLTAVLLGVPSPNSAANVLDGYPMTQRGEGLRALGAAYMTSIMSGIAGALALAISIPIIKPLILAFGPPEFLMLGLLALAFVGTLTGRSITMGLIAVLFGLLLSTIGFAPRGGMSRYSFDTLYLMDGLGVAPVVLGLFALPEIIMLGVAKEPIAKVDLAKAGTKGQLMQGIRDAMREWKLVLRSSMLGIYVGILPGVGAVVAEWAAYGLAVQAAKDKSMFGKGDVRGLIGPEASTHSVKGAELIPTVAFGIPATATMSLLLSALLIHGISPGPEMLTTHLNFTFSLVWTLILANIIGALMLMQWSRQVARLIFVRSNLIVPAVLVICFVGAWMTQNDIADWITLLVFTIIGLAMKRAGLSRPPVILGFVLGPVLEKNLDLSYQALGWTWVQRPMVMAIFCILLLALFFTVRSVRKTRQGLASGQQVEHAGHAMGSDVGVSDLRRIRISMILSALALALFAAALWTAKDWRHDARFFPGIICGIGIPLSLLSLFCDIRSRRAEKQRIAEGGVVVEEKNDFRGVVAMFGFLIFIVLLSIVFGQLLGLPLAVAGYLLWHRESWKIALGQAIGMFVFIYVMFDKIIHVTWIDSWFALPL